VTTGRIALERFGAASRQTPEASEVGVPVPVPDAAENHVPEVPGIDPQAERLASLARISETLDDVASEQAGLRTRCIDDAAAALGAAAEVLLPQLARAGFAELVAETAQSIARRGHWPDLKLAVAPDDAAEIADALGRLGSSAPVQVTADPALGVGEAELGWCDGGAEIDVQSIAEAALERFHSQLKGCPQQGA
jgi:hypothetical protein